MGKRARVALALTFGVLAGACGGDDGSDGASAPTAAETGSTTATSSVATSASDTSAAEPATPQERPTNIEDWEALWAEERAAAVKRITDNGWGTSADGRTVTGPGGFTMDLSACQAGWSNDQGLTDTSIKIASATPLSGAVADYGNLSRATEVIFDHYNDQGAFTDSEGTARTIEFIYRDDGYDPARTIPLVDEFLDSDKVFNIWLLSSPAGLQLYDKLNERCTPNLSSTGHPAWGDPVRHPWTSGSILSYGTEAILWGAFIDQHIDEFGEGKVTIAGLFANNDFGTAFESNLRAFLEESPNKDRFELVTERVEQSAPTVTDPMTTLAAANPAVFIAGTSGAQCTQIIQEAAQNGLQASADYLFIAGVCKGASFVGKEKVGGDGAASNGWWTVGGGVLDFNSTAYDDDAFVSWGRQLLADAGYDYKKSGSFGSGFIYAIPIVQALQIAGELPGGLTNSNYVLALRTMELTHPLLLPGIKYNMDGNDDAYPIEGSEIAKYDAAQQQWIQQGPIVELSGKSQNCAWDKALSRCG
jgi:branched-chain amino acid transport system substrate-binding protein